MRASTGWTFLFALRTTSAAPNAANLVSAPLLLGRLRVRRRLLAAGIQHQPHHLVPQLLPSDRQGTLRTLRRRNENCDRNEYASAGICIPHRRDRAFVHRAVYASCQRPGSTRNRHRRSCGAVLLLRGVLGRICGGGGNRSGGTEPILAGDRMLYLARARERITPPNRSVSAK